jgi:hypothetical protein
MRRSLLALACFAACATGAAAAGAAPQQSGAGTLRLEPQRVGVGERLTVTGRQWPARVRVRLLVGPPASEASPVKRVRTNGRGRFRTHVRIASSATPGPYVMLACRRQCAVKRSASFRITR